MILKHNRSQEWRRMLLMVAVTAVILTGFVFIYSQILAQLQVRYAEYRAKEDIYKILQGHKMDLNHGLEVAEAIITQSKRTEIPVLMFLGLMRTESNFTVRAVSSKHAMGIMQIHPITWKAYVKKLNLPTSREEAFRPSVNIMVSAAILEDLRDKYQRMGYQEPQLWDHVLSAYYAGEGSVKSGLKRHHRFYVNKVRTYINEYGEKMSG
jgi:soluble lytic murein transglycosylase-like protein